MATTAKKKSVKNYPKNRSKIGLSKTERAKLCRHCGRVRHKKEDGTLSPLCVMHLEMARVYMSNYMANKRKGRKKGERSPLPKTRQLKTKKKATKKPIKKTAKKQTPKKDVTKTA